MRREFGLVRETIGFGLITHRVARCHARRGCRRCAATQQTGDRSGLYRKSDLVQFWIKDFGILQVP